VDPQAVAVRVLAHFVPGAKVLDSVAREADWLDIRWCAEDDDTGFYRELPRADVIWHVLRPLSGSDLRRGTRLRLVPKLGAVVNTADTMERYLAEAVANCRRLRDGEPLAHLVTPVVNQPTGC
jgi:hypothetical protein